MSYRFLYDAGARYRVYTWRGGLAYEIVRIVDGASVVLQGDDVLPFEQDLRAAEQNLAAADSSLAALGIKSATDYVCEEYSAVLEIPESN